MRGTFAVPVRILKGLKGPNMGTPGTPSMDFVPFASFPTELAAYSPFSAAPSYRFGYAMLVYSGDYSATNTYGQAIYWWMAMAQHPVTHENFLFIGNSYVPDADVSTTPVVHLVAGFGTAGAINTGNSGLAPNSSFTFNQNGLAIAQICDDIIGGGELLLTNPFGGISLEAITSLYLDPATKTLVGGGIISYADPGSGPLPVNPVGLFPDLELTASPSAGVASPQFQGGRLTPLMRETFRGVPEGTEENLIPEGPGVGSGGGPSVEQT